MPNVSKRGKAITQSRAEKVHCRGNLTLVNVDELHKIVRKMGAEKELDEVLRLRRPTKSGAKSKAPPRRAELCHAIQKKRAKMSAKRVGLLLGATTAALVLGGGGVAASKKLPRSKTTKETTKDIPMSILRAQQYETSLEALRASLRHARARKDTTRIETLQKAIDELEREFALLSK